MLVFFLDWKLLALGTMHNADVRDRVHLHDVGLAEVHSAVELRGPVLLLLDLCLDLQ